MPARRTLSFAPADADAFNGRYLLAAADEPELTLGELLRAHPAMCLQELDIPYLSLKLTSLNIRVEQPPPGTPLYLPPAMSLADFASAVAHANGDSDGRADAAAPGAASASGPARSGRDAEQAGSEADDATGFPSRLSDRKAVLVAHAAEIAQAASYLDGGMSVLVRCEKLLVEHLADEIAALSGRTARHIRPAQAGGPGGGDGHARPDLLGIGGGRRADVMAALQLAVAEAGSDDVIVIPHLDLLAGGSDATLSNEARELTDLLYERSERVILAFTDPSLVVPEVLANRFAIRLAIDILPRLARLGDGTMVPVGRALVTKDEAALFDGFDPIALYKHVAGMNAVRLRHGLRFAYHQYTAGGRRRPAFADLLHELRVFKARTSTAFEVPNVPLEAIGGYDDVKAELGRALEIISGAATDERRLPERLRHDLVPRGFIFHGPPGTGKTLFAKAIASKLDATIMVVSGPEITDMYVGESERKLRELFAEARRNAPAVLVFDEFDSIAGRRTGRDDGGSRAGNAIVAQLLTELDGFRPEVPVLIIGTTNRIDIVDDALLRPSRFRPIKIDLPDEPARRAIAEVHARHFEVECSDRVLAAIANATEGMNGDEIRSVFRDARADELVGERRRPDARRLGELIGALRMSRQQREIDKARQFGRPPAGHAASPMTVVTRRRAIVVSEEDDGDPPDPDDEERGSAS
jgi:transitional endoplasmic reticulum ATPase